MNKASTYPPELIELYSELIEATVAKQRAFKEKELVLFGGIHTEEYSNGLMVVGRAVHGWPYGFSLKNEHNLERRLNRFLLGVNRNVAFNKADKEKYFTPSNRSALWRVVKSVAQEITNLIQYPQNIFYSNLYRVSNYEWNPSQSLRDVQLEICQKIFATEVRVFRPRVILILTGYDWAQPFTSSLGFSLQKNSLEFVERSGLWENSVVIVSKHPMAKPEEPHISELLTIIKSHQNLA